MHAHRTVFPTQYDTRNSRRPLHGGLLRKFEDTVDGLAYKATLHYHYITMINASTRAYTHTIQFTCYLTPIHKVYITRYVPLSVSLSSMPPTMKPLLLILLLLLFPPLLLLLMTLLMLMGPLTALPLT